MFSARNGTWIMVQFIHEESERLFISKVCCSIMEHFHENQEKREFVKGTATVERIDNLGGESQRERIEIELISPCSVQDCINKNSFHMWKHSTCGQRLKLNDNGMLRCPKCWTIGKYIDCPFNCGEHDYKTCSVEGVTHALINGVRLILSKNQEQFILKTILVIITGLITNGGKREKKF